MLPSLVRVMRATWQTCNSLLAVAPHCLQERNRRALELLLQKDATIRALQQQLQQRGGSEPAAAVGQPSAEALSIRAEAAEGALQQAQQHHAAELVSEICSSTCVVCACLLQLFVCCTCFLPLGTFES
jgi:hypothetical protein